MTCKNGNHIIGCSYDHGHVTLDTYVEESRKHPGHYFRYCPSCGVRISGLNDLADEYEWLMDSIEIGNENGTNTEIVLLAD